MNSSVAFLRGNVLTLDDRGTVAEALLLRRDRIIAVGTSAEISALADAQTQRIDLAGRTLLPAFCDAHVHLWKVGSLLTRLLDLRGCPSLERLTQQITTFASNLPPHAWFEGRGYNEALLKESRHPTRHDLDAALGTRPGFLIRTCAHIAVANTAALAAAHIDANTPNPPGGVIERDTTGQPTGILHETALGLVQSCIPAPSQREYMAMISAAQRHQLTLGIASATDPAVTPELIAAYRALDTENALLARTDLLAIRRPDGGTQTYPLPEKYRSEFLRIEGIKFFADGGLSGATAALRTDYRHSPTRGVLRFEENELHALAREVHIAGFQIGTHVIGDAAIEQVLSIYERLSAETPAPHRHRLEHLGLPNADQLRRIAAGNFIAVPQPIFLHELGVNFRRYLTDDYLLRTYPFRSMIDAGIDLAFSSDAPVVRNDAPLSGIKSAILRRDQERHIIAPDQGVTASEALRAYTRGGALAQGAAHERGQLAPGMLADLAILSADPLNTPPEELDQIHIHETWVAGRRAFST